MSSSSIGTSEYWDFVSYVPGELVGSFSSSCGDSYGDDDFDFDRILQWMYEKGGVFDHEACAFGSERAMSVMEQLKEEGFSIVINGYGELRILIGDHRNSNKETENQSE